MSFLTTLIQNLWCFLTTLIHNVWLWIWSLISKILRLLINMVFMALDFIIKKLSAQLSYVVGMIISTKRVVGIFSREGEDSYSFLSRAIQFQNLLVREVRTFTITNDGWNIFTEEASRCDFAILYHSKNRGRINITNVTDSIYDGELNHLSKILGKKNVLVIVDDLDSAAQGDKENILNSQPLIKEKAKGLILFRKDKNTSKEETRKKRIEMFSHIRSTALPIPICKGSEEEGIPKLVSFKIPFVNAVMRPIFEIFNLVGQTRTIELIEKQE